MEPDTRHGKIEETVIEILRNADLETATEYSVRTMVADKLGIDLSDLDHKRLVRRVVESFLLSSSASLEDKVQEETKEVVPEQQGTRPNVDSKEAHDNGGRVICKLSDKRTVAIQDFRGQTLVSIRDYYQRDGKKFPFSRGMSLTAKQWSAIKNSVPAIEEAILKMESRLSRSEDVGKQIEADMSNSVNTLAPEGLIPVKRKQIEADISNSITGFARLGHISIVREQTEADMSNSVSAFAPQGHIQHNPVTAFSPQRLVPIETTRLDGKNYHCWMHLMEFFLKQLKIAYVLTEPCPSISLSPEASVEEIAQAKAAAQKWFDDDYICRHSILNSLSDHLFDQYSKKTYTAKELWEELKLVFDEDFGTKRSQVNKYIQFQMVDGISILEQVQELHKIANSIIASGTWIDENFHVSVIISKLPPSWKEYRMKLMHEEFLPLNMLMCYLRIEEESRNQYKKREPFKNAHAIESKVENKLGPRKREMKGLCYNCGKKGHISRHCHHRKFDVREKVNENDYDVMPVATEANMAEGTVE